jgi:hypothetical protein
MPSLRNSPRIRSAPHKRLFLAISLINATVSAAIFGLGAVALDVYFQNSRASLAVPPQKCLWLDDEKRLFPGPNGSCQQHQEHPIGLLANRSFDLSAEDNERLSEECVFGHEFGLVSGKVSHGSQLERGGSWFCPVDEVVLDRLEAYVCQSFDEGEKAMHSV